MARRPANLPNDKMSQDDLDRLYRNLRMLPSHVVRERYMQIMDRCRFLELPTPKLMQELVVHWKVLWKLRK
jgi:hypothetical protein